MSVDIAILFMAAILFITYTGLLSSIDTAIMMADDVKMAMILEDASLKEKARNRLAKIGAKRDKHMAAMMVFSTFSSVIGNAMLGAMAYEKLSSTGVVIFIMSVTYGSLVFARTIPKIFARIHYDKILMRFAWLARWVYICMTPMVWLTLVWLRLFRMDSKRTMTLGELKSTINYYRQAGLIEKTEEALLQNVFRLKRSTLSDVLRPSTLPSVDKDCMVKDCKELAQTYFGKRILVYAGEDVVGVMYYHDLAARIISEKGGTVEEILRPVVIAEGSENLMDVLSRMKEAKVGQIVVMGESGPLGVVSAKRLYSHILNSDIDQPANPII